jgi:hypothetical protein
MSRMRVIRRAGTTPTARPRPWFEGCENVLTWGLTLLLGVTGLQPSQEAKPSQNPPPGPRPGNQAREPQKAASGTPHPQPGAAPSLFPEGYLDHAGLSAALRRVAAEFPGRVRLEPLARTLRGREVWLATLGPAAGTDAPAARKPAILVVANLEADHLVGGQVAMGLIEQVARDPAWQRRLERCTIYVVPRLNPDGAERVLGRPREEFRTNLEPLDRDRDGKSGEDGPEDINGDGLVLKMRVKDAKATLVPDPADPRLLRKAEAAKGKRAVYSEYAEGIDDDHDGKLNEDPPGGVDLNRNWPHRWTEFDPEAGFSPASEPETQALIRFAFDHPEIVAVWSFGLNDNFATPPKKPESTLDDADLPVFAELSRLFARARNPGGKEKDQARDDQKTQTSTEPKPRAAGENTTAQAVPGATTDGAMSEWAYHQFGVVGLASRVWQGPELPEPGPRGGGEAAGAGAKPPIPADGEARWLYWNDHVMGGRAFVPFAAFDHATLGKVELGGWKPGVRLNPPIEQVEALARGHLAFLGELAQRLPRLAIRDVKVEAKGGDIFQVSATVANDGELPTALAQGVRTRKADPVRVRLDPGPGRILAGSARAQIDSLGGSGGHKEFRWLILAPDRAKDATAPPKITLQASTPKAGQVSVPIMLGKKN